MGIETYEPRNPSRAGPTRSRYSFKHITTDEHLSNEARLGRLIEPQPNGCWLFKGNATEYGRTTLSQGGHRSRINVHRFVYETLIGPVPDDHHLHHECETKGCCNPAHLVPLTPLEHKARHRKHADR